MASSANPYPVEPPGFFLGCLAACVLYGVHVAQVYTYFDKCVYTPHRYLVLWVLSLSTLHMLVVWSSSYRYFVTGLADLTIWGEFWWGLSVQDGLVGQHSKIKLRKIPLMACTAQFYFGRRAWLLSGKNRWIGALFEILPTITMAFGIALAVTARAWVIDPWVSEAEMHSRPIGVPSQIVAIAWMGFSALTDGLLSALLIYHFAKARRSFQWSTRRVAKRLIALTLETVLLTHIAGAVMCIIFLASPPQHRTKNNIFWFLIEIITELYALSILFTIIHHEGVRATMRDDYVVEQQGGGTMSMGQTALDRRVQGRSLPLSTPEPEVWTPSGAREGLEITEVSYFGDSPEGDEGEKGSVSSEGVPKARIKL